jgi:serine-type D-Ala-D-Ala carboxypeptidase (penicillin-binding protein 5/6)
MLTWMDSIMVGKNKDIEQVLVNTNRLINNYNGLLGLKTGYTHEAKYCLSAAAKRKGTKLIAVVLGCDDTKIRFQEAAKLLNHGFANYKNLMFYEKEQPITQVPVECSTKENINIICKENISLLTTSNCKIEDYSIEYKVNEHLKAPLDYLTPIGKLTVSKDGKVLKEFDLYPESEIPKQPFFEFYIKNIIKKLIN